MRGTPRAIAALVFVGLTAVLLAIPVLRADDDARVTRGRKTEARPSPALETPSPSLPNDDEPEEGSRVRYPHECLEHVAPASPPGLIAAYNEGRVTIATPTGELRASFKARPPIQWSPSGRYLLTGGAKLRTSEGERLGDLAIAGGPEGDFAWSPVSDCGATLRTGGLFAFVAEPTSPPVHMVNGVVLSFSFSPDGRRLAVVFGGTGTRLGVIDLVKREVQDIQVSGREPPTLLGWTPDGGTVLYTTGRRLRGALVDDDRPTFVDYNAAIGATGSDFVETCSDRILVVAGRDPDATTDKRLAYIAPGPPPPDFITSIDSVHLVPSCSPNGRFIATLRVPESGDFSALQLVVLESDGSFVTALTDGSEFFDQHPLWGPGGIVFVRAPRDGGTPQVWFAAEGDNADPTGVVVENAADFRGHLGWESLLDWTADRPTGLPPG